MMPQLNPSASAATLIDSFQTSFTSRLYFPYTSLLRPQRRRFSSSLSSQTPRPLSISPSQSQSTSNWFHKWDNSSTQHFHPKHPPPTVFNYRISASSGSGSTMDRIVEKLKKFGYIDNNNNNDNAGINVREDAKDVRRVVEKGSVEDIFYVEDGMLPNARGGISKNLLEGGVDDNDVFGSGRDLDISFPWEKKNVGGGEREEEDVERRKDRSSLAELTLPESELRRLRNIGVRTKTRTKIGGGGATQAVVDMIREKWITAEIVRLKIEGAPALNMKRMHEILEVCNLVYVRYFGMIG